MTACMTQFWKPILGGNLAFIILVLGYGQHDLHNENGMLENLQASLLLISCVLYVALALAQDGRARGGLLGLALLCFSFILREVDFEKVPLPAALTFPFHGTARNLLLLGTWSLYVWYLAGREEDKKGGVLALLGNGYFHLLSTSVLLLLVGALFDKSIPPVAHPRFYEELAEMNAYVLLALPALRLLVMRVPFPSSSAEG